MSPSSSNLTKSHITKYWIASALLLGIQAVGVDTTTVNDNVLTTIFAVVVYVVTTAIVIGLPWLIIKHQTNRSDLGLTRLPNWTDIAMTPVGLVVYLLISALLVFAASALLPGFDANQAQDVGFEGLNQRYELVLAFITLVILAPFAEEVLFRGYLFGKLQRYVPIWVAIVVTSLLFGAIHGAWNLALDTFALSVILCMLRVSTGSLWAPILLHMTKNGIAFYLLFINPLLLNTIGG
jgi:membrane protease YdiL (CAAX protease family)